MPSSPTAPGWTSIWIAVALSVAIFIGLSGACFAALGPIRIATIGVF
jgi:hypothetical protein